MISDFIRFYRNPVFTKYRILPILGFVMLSAIATGCGGNTSSATTTTTLTGNTMVTILSSSTSNDKLSEYTITMNTLTLTSQSGNTVNLLTTPLYPEFIHVNGMNEPLNTVSIPQGTYSSAIASLGSAGYICSTVGSDGFPITHYFGSAVGGIFPASDVTINLPSPITISGDSMVLSLDMLVSQSASYSSCSNDVNVSYSITPTFSLTPMSITPQPTNVSNGIMNSLEGIIASINNSGESLEVASADPSNYGGGNPGNTTDPANGPNWQITANDSTLYQGITGPSQLAAGMAVDIYAVLQRDGSLLATRISVYDTNATNVSLWIVPIIDIENIMPRLNTADREQIGPLPGGDGAPVDFSNTAFHISGQLTNMASLPFLPSFNASNMVAGQIIEITFHAPSNYSLPYTGFPATTITLMPQTINGTVSTISASSGFTAYTIALASYDLFPALAVQADQNTLLTGPSTVVVYADSNTQMLNSDPIAVGSVVRFNGLVFNDNGTLRMDCGQINDGVAE